MIIVLSMLGYDNCDLKDELKLMKRPRKVSELPQQSIVRPYNTVNV